MHSDEAARTALTPTWQQPLTHGGTKPFWLVIAERIV
jgi:hypothetical protein